MQTIWLFTVEFVADCYFLCARMFSAQSLKRHINTDQLPKKKNPTKTKLLLKHILRALTSNLDDFTGGERHPNINVYFILQK